MQCSRVSPYGKASKQEKRPRPKARPEARCFQGSALEAVCETEQQRVRLISAVRLACAGRGRGVEPVIRQERTEVTEYGADLRAYAAGRAPIGRRWRQLAEAGDALWSEGAVDVHPEAVLLIHHAAGAREALVLAGREEAARTERLRDGQRAGVITEHLPADAAIDGQVLAAIPRRCDVYRATV